MPATALLRSAASTRKKVLAQQDAEYSYQWSNSFKTYDDYLAYSDYLDKRAKSSSDPSMALQIRKEQDSAFKGYISNEIQRQSINVLEGRQSNIDKYNAIYNLYKQAIDRGLYDQAQSMYLQLDQLDKTIQSEAQTSAGAALTASKKQIDATIKAQQGELKSLGELFTKLGPDGMNEYMKDPQVQAAMVEMNPAFKQVFDAGGTIGVFDIANGIMSSIKDTYAQAVSQLPPDEAQAYQDKLDALTSGATGVKIPGIEGSGGGGAVTFQDLQDQITAAQNGGTAFFRGPNGTQVKGQVTDYTWGKDGKIINTYANPFSVGTQDNPDNQVIDQFKQSQVYRRDANGNYVDDKGKIVAKYKDGQILDASGKQFASEADKNKALGSANIDYETLLKNQGFNIIRKGDQTYVTAPTGANIPGFDSTEPMQVVTDSQGNIRFIKKDPQTGNQQLYQVGFDAEGKANVRELKPGEQGAISSNSLVNVDVANRAATKGTGFSQLDIANQNLANVSNTIAQGDNFTHGILANPQRRAEFLGAAQNPLSPDGRTGVVDKNGVFHESIAPTKLQLNPWEKVVQDTMSAPAGAYKSAIQAKNKIFSTVGTAASKASLVNSTNVIQGGNNFKYGVLANPANRQAFAANLSNNKAGQFVPQAPPQPAPRQAQTIQQLVQDAKKIINAVRRIKLW